MSIFLFLPSIKSQEISELDLIELHIEQIIVVDAKHSIQKKNIERCSSLTGKHRKIRFTTYNINPLYDFQNTMNGTVCTRES